MKGTLGSVAAGLFLAGLIAPSLAMAFGSHRIPSSFEGEFQLVSASVTSYCAKEISVRLGSRYKLRVCNPGYDNSCRTFELGDHSDWHEEWYETRRVRLSGRELKAEIKHESGCGFLGRCDDVSRTRELWLISADGTQLTHKKWIIWSKHTTELKDHCFYERKER